MRSLDALSSGVQAKGTWYPLYQIWSWIAVLAALYKGLNSNIEKMTIWGSEHVSLLEPFEWAFGGVFDSLSQAQILVTKPMLQEGPPQKRVLSHPERHLPGFPVLHLCRGCLGSQVLEARKCGPAAFIAFKACLFAP